MGGGGTDGDMKLTCRDGKQHHRDIYFARNFIISHMTEMVPGVDLDAGYSGEHTYLRLRAAICGAR